MLQIEPGALGMLGRPFVTKLQHQPKSPLKEFCVNVGAGMCVHIDAIWRSEKKIARVSFPYRLYGS